MRRRGMNIVTLTVCALLNVLVSSTVAAHSAHASFDTGGSHAIVTDSAVPLVKGEWAVGVQFETIESDRLTDEAMLALRENDPDADLHSVGSVSAVTLGVAYGLTSKTTIGFTLPYVAREDIREPPHHDELVDGDSTSRIEPLGDSSGAGDATLFVLRRIAYRPESNTNLALLFGIKTPTGRTSERTPNGERFETELQPGSGSWDPFVGLAFSQWLGGLTFDTSGRYTVGTDGSQNTNLGDVFAYNAGLAYRLPSSVNLVLELNGEWRDRLDVGNRTDRNSGGHYLYLSPGISFDTQRWSLSASLGVPVIDDPNGDQDEREFRLLVGFQWKR